MSIQPKLLATTNGEVKVQFSKRGVYITNKMHARVIMLTPPTIQESQWTSFAQHTLSSTYQHRYHIQIFTIAAAIHQHNSKSPELELEAILTNCLTNCMFS